MERSVHLIDANGADTEYEDIPYQADYGNEVLYHPSLG